MFNNLTFRFSLGVKENTIIDVMFNAVHTCKQAVISQFLFKKIHHTYMYMYYTFLPSIVDGTCITYIHVL
jgi:hypothetical protein